MFIKKSRAKLLPLPIVIGGVAVMVLKIFILMHFCSPSRKRHTSLKK